MNDEELRSLRWSTLALIPQGAMNSLNPVMRINQQVAEAINTHEGRQDKAKLKQRILDLFKQVGLPSRIYDMYPHELSGGMKQRVCIAMADRPAPIADYRRRAHQRAGRGGAARGRARPCSTSRSRWASR